MYSLLRMYYVFKGRTKTNIYKLEIFTVYNTYTTSFFAIQATYTIR